MRARIFRLAVSVFFCQTAFTQAQNVSGTVVDESNNPLKEVKLTHVPSKTSTTTGEDGKFILVAKKGDAITVSKEAYQTETVYVNSDSLRIVLKSAVVQLNEVVIVGYGTQKKGEISAAVSTIKGSEITKQPVNNALQGLQGKSSGVQIIGTGRPGESPKVVIRGTSSALSGNNILYVVDGMLTDDINNINPADIVSINVLKDASASAQYGSRGANGVVIVTTKRGKSGEYVLNYTNSIGSRQATHLVDMANAKEYTNYYTATTTNPPTVSNPSNTDWYTKIIRTGIMQNHAISLAGGTSRALNYFSLGYLSDEGIVINNKYSRLTLRTNNEYYLNKIFTLGLNASYVIENNHAVNIATAFNDAYRASPLIEGQVDGRYGNTSAYQNVGNPILDLNQNFQKYLTNRAQGTIFLQAQAHKNLVLKSSLSLDKKNMEEKNYNYQFFADENTFLTAGGNQYNNNSSLKMRYNSTFWQVWDNTATFSKELNDHSIKVLLGTTAEMYNYHYLEGERRDVPENQDLWYLDVGDANTSTNGAGGELWTRLSFLSKVNYSYKQKYVFAGSLRRDGSSRLPVTHRWGYYPAASAAWLMHKEAFIANIAWINQLKWRAGFGKVGNDQIPTNSYQNTFLNGYAYAFNYGALAQNGKISPYIVDKDINWEITTEKSFGLDYSLFKNRIFGELNYYHKMVDNALFPIKIPATSGSSIPIISNIASILNKGWEASINYRGQIKKVLGVVAGFNITHNQNKVTKINLPSTIIDGGIGASQAYTTITRVGDPIGSFYVYKVLGVFQTNEEITSYKSSNGTVIQATAVPGDFKYADINNDGKIDDNDRTVVGSYQPKYYLNFNGGFNFKQFDLSFDFYSTLGAKVYNGKKAFRQNAKDNIEKDMAYKRWVPGANINDEPAANAGNLPASTYFVESGDFIRLNNVNLGYSLNGKALSKLKLRQCRIVLVAQNLFTWTKYSGFTPELSGSPTTLTQRNNGFSSGQLGSPTASGIEFNAYPTTKTVAIGIQIGI